jgi:hypothetical protein
MTPIKDIHNNGILKGNGDNVVDLHVTRMTFSDNVPGVESCWKCSWKERIEILLRGRVYFLALAKTHPPICLSTRAEIDKQSDQKVNKVHSFFKNAYNMVKAKLKG